MRIAAAIELVDESKQVGVYDLFKRALDRAGYASGLRRLTGATPLADGAKVVAAVFPVILTAARTEGGRFPSFLRSYHDS
jgi:hypothetical protein